MKLIPEIDLGNWSVQEDEHLMTVTYEFGNLRIVEGEYGNLNLYIKSSDGIFNHIKQIDNYYELMSLNIYLNADIIADNVEVDFHLELFDEIRDSFNNFNTLIINKKTGNTFGVNDLIESNNWNDALLKQMWDNNDIIVISLSDDIDPLIWTECGWSDINVNLISDDIALARSHNIDIVI